MRLPAVSACTFLLAEKHDFFGPSSILARVCQWSLVVLDLLDQGRPLTILLR